MEYPSGHHRHDHHHRDEEEQFPPPPPPPSQHHHQSHIIPQPDYRDEQYPVVSHQHHRPQEERYSESSFRRPSPPRQPDFNYSGFPPESSLNYPHPPPPSHNVFESDPGYPSVQHVSHGVEPGFESNPSEIHSESGHHCHRPHLPSFLHHQSHDGGSKVANKPTVRVYSKAETGYSLTIRDGKVILARSDENDEFQHWIKDEKYSTRVKDEEAFPSFALVNKATGQAIKHSIGATHPVQLIPYNPDVLDESVLWTESKDLGDGYRTIRMVNNIRLNVDAFNGDKNHGGVHDGTTIVLWEWKKGENQRWKIVPY